MDSGQVEYLGGTPVTINATNGAIVHATFIVKVEVGKDSLRRWAEAITLNEVFGTPMAEEFVCEARVLG